MAVDQWPAILVPPVRQHPQPVPELPLLFLQALHQLREWREDCCSAGGHVDDVVDGVGEGLALEAAVDVPARAPDAGATVEWKSL